MTAETIVSSMSSNFSSSTSVPTAQQSCGSRAIPDVSIPAIFLKRWRGKLINARLDDSPSLAMMCAILSATWLKRSSSQFQLAALYAYCGVSPCTKYFAPLVKFEIGHCCPALKALYGSLAAPFANSSMNEVNRGFFFSPTYKLNAETSLIFAINAVAC